MTQFLTRYAGQLLLLYLGFAAVQHAGQGLDLGESSFEQKMISVFENNPASIQYASDQIIQQLGQQAAQPMNTIYSQAVVPVARELANMRNGGMAAGQGFSQQQPGAVQPTQRIQQREYYPAKPPQRSGFVQNMELPAAGLTRTSMVVNYER
jgi:hypothetical protein